MDHLNPGPLDSPNSFFGRPVVRGILIAIGVIAFVSVATWQWVGGTEGIVEAALPEFPDLPAPTQSLAAGDSGTLYFESATPFDFDVILGEMENALPTVGLGELILPESASVQAPVPAMVILHGSGGISPGRERETGQFLADHGIAAFVIDYYKPRGITDETPYMLRVISVTEFDALTDAYSALRLLASHPEIDSDRIGVMGFSYGGMATRFAMDERVRRALSPDHPFAAFVDFYGPCFQDLGTKEVNGAPLLTLRGTEDASNNLQDCTKREEAMRSLGVTVEAHVFDGAGHAWEVDSPRKLHEEAPYLDGCTVTYDMSGSSQVEGKPIVKVPPGTSRPARIAIRMRSGSALQDCVKSGYVIGRDDETRKKAESALLAFLGRTFQTR